MNIKRNAKFFGLDLTSIQEDYVRTVDTCRKISKYVSEEIRSGNIVHISKNGYVTYSDDTVITKAKFKDKIFHLFPDDACNESLKRDAVIYILERYAGYMRRNGGDRALNIKCPISIKGKSLYFKDNFITINKKDKTLSFKTMFTGKGESRIVKYSHALKEDDVVKKKFGGNLVMSQRCFVVGVDSVRDSFYTPKGMLAFDLNKDEKSWIWFSDGDVITPNDKIKSLIKKIKELNKKLDKDKKVKVEDRTLRSQQRRPIRMEWKESHRHMKNEITKICKSIVDKAVKNNSLLCIDSVKTGQKMGTFGQDHIIPILQTMCENRCVPFYVVPCKNTSRRCACCGNISKDNRIDTDNFLCVGCGFTGNAQQNGADNIAYQGRRMYDAGVPFGNWGRRSVDKLVEEYMDS